MKLEVSENCVAVCPAGAIAVNGVGAAVSYPRNVVR